MKDIITFLQESNKKYNNDPELIKLLLDYVGKDGHKKIQNELIRELINKYVELTKKLNEKIDFVTLLSETDPLTKIYNRIKFKKELKEKIDNFRKYKNVISLIMFDIDHFKNVNDNFGHDIGDEVLIKTVEIVKNHLEEYDIFTRWGGEEFMILLPGKNIKDAYKLAEIIRKSIENYEYRVVKHITSSFGVTEINENDDFYTITKRVDQALYHSKESGRNKVTIK
ncbi:MAG: hypothetical protein PWP46_1479 [Fusobacteriaceae bacterium]|jgi:diguanylate cyclase (GGDEF)-like protein|nr:hypothetical protein [Fusobacteriaceae bacterium]